MIKLYYTPRSHFARKVRILLDAWKHPVELFDVGNVASSEAFGGNPLMKVPALVDGETTMWESDHIATYLVRKLDPHDTYDVLTRDVDTLNARAALNGIMNAEVSVILARRTGIDTGQYTRFTKILESIHRSLQWLEESAVFPTKPSYLGFHLVCVLDHLRLYELVELDYPRLTKIANQLSSLPYVAKSAPS